MRKDLTAQVLFENHVKRNRIVIISCFFSALLFIGGLAFFVSGNKGSSGAVNEYGVEKEYDKICQEYAKVYYCEDDMKGYYELLSFTAKTIKVYKNRYVENPIINKKVKTDTILCYTEAFFRDKDDIIIHKNYTEISNIDKKNEIFSIVYVNKNQKRQIDTTTKIKDTLIDMRIERDRAKNPGKHTIGIPDEVANTQVYISNRA